MTASSGMGNGVGAAASSGISAPAADSDASEVPPAAAGGRLVPHVAIEVVDEIGDGTEPIPSSGQKKVWKKWYKWSKEQAGKAERLFLSLKNSKKGKGIRALFWIYARLNELYGIIECLSVWLCV